MSFRKISKNNNRNKDKMERKYTQTHTRENIKILSGSAFSVRPQAGTKRNFTNKCGEYKWCNGTFTPPKPQYTQCYSLLEIQN